MQAVGHGTYENYGSQFLVHIHRSASLGTLTNTLGHIQNAAAAAAAAYASATKKDPNLHLHGTLMAARELVAPWPWGRPITLMMLIRGFLEEETYSYEQDIQAFQSIPSKHRHMDKHTHMHPWESCVMLAKQ